MNEIKELLMKSVKNSTSSYNKQQDQIPEPNKCKFCGKKIYWYYFKSHNEYMFESKWIEHLCICRIISWLSYKLNSSEQQIEKIKRSMEEENSKRDSNTDKLSRMQNARNGIEQHSDKQKQLMCNMLGIKSNLEYLEKRFDIADAFDAWQELFDCRSKKETQETMNELYEDGHDKFVIQYYKQKG